VSPFITHSSWATCSSRSTVGTFTIVIARLESDARSFVPTTLTFQKSTTITVHPPGHDSDNPHRAQLTFKGSDGNVIRDETFDWPTGNPLLADENWLIKYDPKRTLREDYLITKATRTATEETEIKEKQSIIVHFTGNSLTISELTNPGTSGVAIPQKGHCKTQWGGVEFDSVGPMEAFWDKAVETTEIPPELPVQTNP
jgi:hypothetical protein